MATVQPCSVPASGACPRQEVDPSPAQRCRPSPGAVLRQRTHHDPVLRGSGVCRHERPPRVLQAQLARRQGHQVGVVRIVRQRLAQLHHGGPVRHRRGLGTG
uniref:(northern house mosquito) hypothetical protein n=1 Tax=Culex pipiens TaxID=7175 RepID=A0A8D8BH16_CULPI